MSIRIGMHKEYSSLNDRKSKLYEDYRQAKKQMQEYGVVKKNVDSILYPSQSKARGCEPYQTHHLQIHHKEKPVLC